jgi:hypothetical protein
MAIHPMNFSPKNCLFFRNMPYTLCWPYELFCSSSVTPGKERLRGLATALVIGMGGEGCARARDKGRKRTVFEYEGVALRPMGISPLRMGATMNATVTLVDGSVKKLSEFWAGNRLVIVFLRHFG